MAAPVFESVAQATARNFSVVSSVTCDKPSGTVKGDLLFVSLGVRSTVNIDTDYVVPPAGFSLFADHSANPTRSNLYYKIAGESEPSSYLFDWSGGSWTGGNDNSGASIAIARISGADQASPIHKYDAARNNTQTCPSITTTVDQCLLLGVVTENGGGNTRDWDAPFGWTKQWRANSGASGLEGQVGASRSQATAGATGTAAFVRTAGGGVTTQNWHIAIAPGQSGGLLLLMQHHGLFLGDN